MKWIEAKIEVEGDDADVVAALLLDFGIEGIEFVDPYENARHIEDNASTWDYVDDSLVAPEKGLCLLRFYVTEDAAVVLPTIKEVLSPFGLVKTNEVEDDWSEAWKQHYKPFKIGKNIVIAPVWEKYNATDGEIVFKIDPGHVFGTGQHQSTALCIAMLEKYVAHGVSALDIGCGSGILGIISSLLGAAHVTAVDIDPAAVKVCRENAALNNLADDRFAALSGNILTDAVLCDNIGGKFDVVIANIIADIIIPMAPIVKKFLSPDGVFITSGIIKMRCDDVVAALETSGFKIIEIVTQDEWVAMVAQI